MKDIMKNILDRVFSISTFAFIAAGLFIFLIIRIGEKERFEKEQRKAQVAACYNVGMVLVESDAGPRCATPSNLIAMK